MLGRSDNKLYTYFGLLLLIQMCTVQTNYNWDYITDLSNNDWCLWELQSSKDALWNVLPIPYLFFSLPCCAYHHLIWRFVWWSFNKWCCNTDYLNNNRRCIKSAFEVLYCRSAIAILISWSQSKINKRHSLQIDNLV